MTTLNRTADVTAAYFTQEENTMNMRMRNNTALTIAAIAIAALALTATSAHAVSIAFNSFEGDAGELNFTPSGTGTAIPTTDQMRTGSQSLLFDAAVTAFSATFDAVDVSGYTNVELEIFWLTQASAFEGTDLLSFTVTHDGSGAPLSPIIKNVTEAELDTINVWTEFSTFIPDDATTLSLIISGTTTEAVNEDIFFDDLLITGTPPPVVPEPSTFALAALGLLGLTRLRRRRR